MGLDQNLSTRDMIAATRHIMRQRIPPKIIAKSNASVNENVLTGIDIDVTRFPAPKFWPGDGGRYIGTGDITLTRDPATRRIDVGAIARWSSRATGSAGIARPASTAGSTARPGGRAAKAVRGGGGLRGRSGAVHGVGPGVRRRRQRVRHRGWHHGVGIEPTQAEYVTFRFRPMRIAIEGVLRRASSCRRSARRVHRLLRR